MICCAGIESAWHLDKVVVHNSATDEKVIFKCKAWLDATSGDGQTERNFYPLTYCSYKVELQTSDLRAAGTSANGVISLIGKLAEAGPFQLLNDGQTFQRGSLDVMTQDGLPDIGPIEQAWLTTSALKYVFFCLHVQQTTRLLLNSSLSWAET